MILNLLYRKEIALSFLTNGQSVPDDIVPATPEALADLLLRE
jgi:flagellar biosynthesis protein FlhF